uniref:C-type lectin domain-containing protein n=1 Tax=Takifugu rubripes TaxID=31033 RepID=A0A3B5KD06_TAKRU
NCCCSPSYTLQHSQMTFDKAAEACSPGHLTTVLNKHELAHILDLIPEAEPPLIRGSFTFWVGLRKDKRECVVPEFPLRGFKWTADDSEETQVSQWAAEPELTCTAVQCAALKAQVDSSNVTDWGLIPVRCETKHRFICKHNDSHTPQPPKPTARIQVECWTAGMQVEIRCSGQPALWRLLDGSVANFTSICVPCDDGFRKNSSGKCEDIDECREKSAPCRNTCQNTPGSYRCVCTDETGEVVSEDSLMCNDTAGTADKRLDSGLLVPVLVAVVGLVVLVVLFAVMVKCCVMRRSKRRAVKKAEKMSMNSKDEKKPAI